VTVPVLFLAVALWGATFTVVALRPPRRPQWLMAVGFFAAWLTTELALWHLVWQAAAAAVFVTLGGLDAWPGWAALGVTAASWAGLGAEVLTAHRTSGVFRAALADSLGASWAQRLHPTWTIPVSPMSWRRVALPFRFRRTGVERVADLDYWGDGIARHRLDVYRRAGAGPGAPVLLQIHGGAWVIGRKDQQGLPLMYHLAERGWVCVALNYRLSPRATWPDQLVDCKRALAWIREHIAEFGGDPEYVVVTGGSAGGHLTAMVGLTPNDPRWQPGFEDVDTRVRAMIPFYAVYDWTDRFGIRGPRDGLRTRILERLVVKRRYADVPELFDEASPMSHLGPHAPPALMVHGTRDRLTPVAEAREFVRMLRGVSRQPVAYAELPGAHHAFEILVSVRALHTVAGVDLFLTWLLATDPPAAFPVAAVEAVEAVADVTSGEASGATVT
jgi:acetyl esterase/lipase